MLCRIPSLHMQALQHDDEFVSPQPCHRVFLAHTCRQAAGNGFQQQVALVVALGVVQGFEVIQIDEQQGARAVAARAGQYRMAQAVQQQAAVGKFG